MKLQQINYDSNEEFDSIVVRIERNEAIALVNVLGQMNGHATRKLKIDSEMFYCLDSVFNREDDEGYPRLDVKLKELNDE